jgi:hypothetical protein
MCVQRSAFDLYLAVRRGREAALLNSRYGTTSWNAIQGYEGGTSIQGSVHMDGGARVRLFTDPKKQSVRLQVHASRDEYPEPLKGTVGPCPQITGVRKDCDPTYSKPTGVTSMLEL